jgi:nucleoside-diphosphate-sugar epimerase
MSEIQNHSSLVSGSAGFLGFQGLRALLARGAKVIGGRNYHDYLGMVGY